MTSVERKLAVVIVGALSSAPAIWLATGVLLEFFPRSDDLVFGVKAVFVAGVAALTGAVLVAVSIVRKRRARATPKWLKQYVTLGRDGLGGDLGSWLLGFAAGLWMWGSEKIGLRETRAWTAFAALAVLALLMPLVRDSWRKWQGRAHSPLRLNRTERSFLIAIVGILASDPIIWLAQAVISKYAWTVTLMLTDNGFFLRHRDDHWEDAIAIAAISVPLISLLLIAELIAGRGSLKKGSQWISDRSFSPVGRGSDLFAWLTGFAVDLMMQTLTTGLSLARWTAWAWLTVLLSVVLLIRLLQGYLERYKKVHTAAIVSRGRRPARREPK
jgi:hypothetical protein